MQQKEAPPFFHFTRKERNGIVVLLCIVAALLCLPFLYSTFLKKADQKKENFQDEMALLQKLAPKTNSEKSFSFYNRDSNNTSYYHSKRNRNEETVAEYFYFDPNTLHENGWKKLGVRDKTIGTIKNFISKGGRFRLPEDIRKIWGISKYQADRLIPYVAIKERETIAGKDFRKYENKPFSKKSTASIDANNADSNTYQSLPGIGAGYARRIVKFRDKLGGFYSVNQVAETFGLPDSTFQKIKGHLQISEEGIKKININLADLEQLKEHPYIRYKLANAIVQYRSQHGNFLSVEDIKKIMLVTDEVYLKLYVYLTVE